MLKFRCVHCGTAIKVSDDLAGRKGKCPRCRKTITIPVRGEDGGADVLKDLSMLGRLEEEAPAVHDWPAEGSPKNFKPALIIGAVTLLVVAVLVAWVALGDNWEKQHTEQIVSMEKEARACMDAGQFSDAEAKYASLLALVEGKQLKSQQLIEAVTRARAGYDLAEVNVRYQPQKGRIDQWFDEAQKALKEDNPELAVARYQSVLGLIQKSGTSAGEFGRVLELAKGSLAKAQAAVEQKKARLAHNSPPEGPPLPDAGAMAAAQQTVWPKYTAEIQAAYDPPRKKAVVQKLLDAAAASPHGSAEKLVILQLAGELAVQAGDAALACKTVDEPPGFPSGFPDDEGLDADHPGPHGRLFRRGRLRPLRRSSRYRGRRRRPVRRCGPIGRHGDHGPWP